jgi:hypothetical protein
LKEEKTFFRCTKTRNAYAHAEELISLAWFFAPFQATEFLAVILFLSLLDRDKLLVCFDR